MAARSARSFGLHTPEERPREKKGSASLKADPGGGYSDHAAYPFATSPLERICFGGGVCYGRSG